MAKFIKESFSLRIDTTQRLAKAIEKSEIPPKLFISASAVGQLFVTIILLFWPIGQTAPTAEEPLKNRLRAAKEPFKNRLRAA